MRNAKWTLAGLVAVLALGLIVSADAQVASGKKGPPTSLKAGLVSSTKLKEDVVEKLLKALGPAVTEQLRNGREVELPGLGTLRVIRVAEYRDLVAGRPNVIPARNTVEFVPTAGLNNDANSAGARPARTVEAMEFRVNPSSDPGMRAPTTRNLGTRTR